MDVRTSSHPGIMEDSVRTVSRAYVGFSFVDAGLKGKGYSGIRGVARYTYVSPGHHFRGTAIPWESKVSFKHSEVLSYQSENEFLVRFLICQTIERRSMKWGRQYQKLQWSAGQPAYDTFTIVSRVGNICRPNVFQ
jgi:hypothetical protein